MSTGTSSKSFTFMFLACFLFGEAYAAGFHVWVDEMGRKHVSTIARAGFDQQGALRRPYDPNSLTSQYPEMRRMLARQAAEILSEQAEQERLQRHDQVAPSSEGVRTPKEGIMGLRDLIQLERRGGRYSEK